jgi:hypothetical protein
MSSPDDCELLVPIAGGLFAVGLLFAVIAAVLLVVALRQPAAAAGIAAPTGFGSHPVSKPSWSPG